MQSDAFFDLVPVMSAPVSSHANLSFSLFGDRVLSMKETSAAFSHPLQRALIDSPEAMKTFVSTIETDPHNTSTLLGNASTDGLTNVYLTQVVLSPGGNPGSNIFFLYVIVAYSLLLLCLGMFVACTFRVCRGMFCFPKKKRQSLAMREEEEEGFGVESQLVCDTVAARCLHCGCGSCSVCGQELGVIMTNKKRRKRWAFLVCSPFSCLGRLTLPFCGVGIRTVL